MPMLSVALDGPDEAFEIFVLYCETEVDYLIKHSVRPHPQPMHSETYAALKCQPEKRDWYYCTEELKM
jgi:hypothetical protein